MFISHVNYMCLFRVMINMSDNGFDFVLILIVTIYLCVKVDLCDRYCPIVTCCVITVLHQM